MSRPPSTSTVRATVRVMSSALNTSHVSASARPPCSVIFLAVATTLASVRPAQATAAPAAARASAMPSPTPCPAPVTRASFPVSSPIFLGSRRRYARKPVGGEFWRHSERLHFLIEPFVDGLRNAPLALRLHVLVPVQGTAGGTHLLGKVDEDVGQVPD